MSSEMDELRHMLKDENYRKEYESVKPEMDKIRKALHDSRKEREIQQKIKDLHKSY
ncbi:MAG: hypothetical protein PUB39_02385 [Eubacteriales bacterium]|nr:hypothetical protein [Eubacteriales bacterium]